jgi:DNA-binding NtrC family response regulator
LLVDDEPAIRETLAEFLIQEGHSVTSCGSGERAVDLVTKQAYDVVVCDINLPGLDGIDVLERLRANHPAVPVLLITAYATAESAVEAFQKGATDYLIKPFQLIDLANKLNSLKRKPLLEGYEGFDDLGEASTQFEKHHIERVLRETPDKRRAAKRLGIGLSSLYRKIDEHGLQATE